MPARDIRTVIALTLICGHTINFPKPAPVKGQAVLCRACDAYRDVTGAPESISLRCKHCTLSRTCGRNIDAARRTAGGHVVKRNTHTVVIYDGETEVEIVTLANTTDQLPIEHNGPHPKRIRPAA